MFPLSICVIIIYLPPTVTQLKYVNLTNRIQNKQHDEFNGPWHNRQLCYHPSQLPLYRKVLPTPCMIQKLTSVDGETRGDQMNEAISRMQLIGSPKRPWDSPRMGPADTLLILTVPKIIIIKHILINSMHHSQGN